MWWLIAGFIAVYAVLPATIMFKDAVPMALHKADGHRVTFLGEWVDERHYECSCGRDWSLWVGSD